MEYDRGLDVLVHDHGVGFAVGLVGPLAAAAAGAFGPGLAGGFLADGLLRGIVESGDAVPRAGQQAEIADPPAPPAAIPQPATTASSAATFWGWVALGT